MVSRVAEQARGDTTRWPSPGLRPLDPPRSTSARGLASEGDGLCAANGPDRRMCFMPRLAEATVTRDFASALADFDLRPSHAADDERASCLDAYAIGEPHENKPS